MKRLLVTLGPASLTPDCIRAMTASSPYVFRLNMSHVSLEDLPRHIALIRDNTDIPICIDSEGAQIRTHVVRNGGCVLTTGDEVEKFSPSRLAVAEMQNSASAVEPVFKPVAPV